MVILLVLVGYLVFANNENEYGYIVYHWLWHNIEQGNLSNIKYALLRYVDL